MDQLATIIAGEICLSKDHGSSMKKWREIFGVSQSNLARYLKISSSTISDYESGRRKSPGILVISRLVQTLLEIDKKNEGKIAKQLAKDFKPKEQIFDLQEFASAMNGKTFAETINANILANPQKLKETNIYGYTVIDSLKVILEVPVTEYIQMYGKTPERALVFTKVETGRSPMIAVRVGRFSTEMKPSIIVLHGIEKADPIAIKIAEIEKIPLLVTTKPIEEIKETLKKYET